MLNQNTNYYEVQEQPEIAVFEFAEFVRQRRADLQMSQDLLSELSGIKQPYISELERGLRPGVTYGVVVKLSMALNSTIVFKNLR